MCRVLSRICYETSHEPFHETSHETSSSVLQPLVSGLLLCLRRIATVKRSADDAEMIQRLSYCEGLISTECHQLTMLNTEVYQIK